jgi:hypothetical protein
MGLTDNRGKGSIADVARAIYKLYEVFKRTIFPPRLYPVDDTTAISGVSGYAIQFITDSVITSITTINVVTTAPWAALTVETFSAGTIIYVKYSAIELASGAAILYLDN